VTGLTGDNKVYDGNTTATLDTGNATLAGVESGDDGTLVVASAIGAFADADVGTSKTVTISGLTISGADAGNYSLTQPTTTADITEKPFDWFLIAALISGVLILGGLITFTVKRMR